MSDDRSEIVFFDLETTVPTRPGQGFAIIEFGAILVCPRKLTELQHYCTFVRPADSSLTSPVSERSNGITAEAVSSAPTFAEIADNVYELLHGRIWAGHNIIRFDCVRVKDAFAQVNKKAPEPKGIIDSLVVLTQKFGRRAGDMKMASIAKYFGLGRQTHRSLDDVRLNLEILKYCSTVMLLESSLPNIFTENSWVSPNVVTRSRSNAKKSSDGASSSKIKDPATETMEEDHPIRCITMSEAEGSLTNTAQPNSVQLDAFDMATLVEIISQPIESDVVMDEKAEGSPNMSFPSSEPYESSSSTAVLEPDKISIPSIEASLVPYFPGINRIELVHNGFPFQIRCTDLRVRFGISTKFVDHAGRPRLNFVVDPSPRLCMVLDACNNVAHKLFLDSGSSSDWRPVVTRKEGFFNYPTIRLHIPTAVVGDIALYATEIYKKEPSGAEERLSFSKFDAAELGSLFVPGTFVDALFSLDPYDYQHNAGIKLVAKKLFIHA